MAGNPGGKGTGNPIHDPKTGQFGFGHGKAKKTKGKAAKSDESRAARHAALVGADLPAAQKAAVGLQAEMLGGNTLSGDEAKALNDYSYNDYHPINSYLRHGGEGAALKDQIALIDSAMAKSRLTEDTTLYRMVTPEFAAQLRNMKVGDTYTDPAYTSTTLDKGVAEDLEETGGLFDWAEDGDEFYAAGSAAVITIEAPKGTQALLPLAVLGEDDEHPTSLGEAEVLLHRDATFELVSANKARNEFTFALKEPGSKTKAKAKVKPAQPQAPSIDTIKPSSTSGEFKSYDDGLTNDEKGYKAGAALDAHKALQAPYMAVINDDDKVALDNWTGGYTSYNIAPMLRTGQELDANSQDEVRLLDAAFSKASLPESLEVYRGVNGKMWDQVIAAGVGATYTDGAYVSATMRRKIATEFSGRGDIIQPLDFSSDTVERETPGGVLVMHLPKGTKAIPWNNMPGEAQILINRGTEFHISDIDEKNHTITLDVMPDDGGVTPPLWSDTSTKQWVESASDYRGQHEAPDHESGAPMHDLTDTYPDDFYGPNGFRYYADFGNSYDREVYSTVVAMHNHPGKVIRVYRAVPKDAKGEGINVGDWVTVSRKYADDHGAGRLGEGKYKIVSKTVHARDLFSSGDYLPEWGYDPQPYDAKVEKRYKDKRRGR